MTLMVIGFLVGFGFGLIKAYKQFKGLQRAVMMVFASLVMGMVGVVAGIAGTLLSDKKNRQALGNEAEKLVREGKKEVRKVATRIKKSVKSRK